MNIADAPTIEDANTAINEHIKSELRDLAALLLDAGIDRESANQTLSVELARLNADRADALADWLENQRAEQ